MRWRRNPRVLWRTAPGYLVLATVDDDTTEVAGPGADIWMLLETWIPDHELAAALARRYGADEPVVSQDVGALLKALHAQGYVERRD